MKDDEILIELRRLVVIATAIENRLARIERQICNAIPAPYVVPGPLVAGTGDARVIPINTVIR